MSVFRHLASRCLHEMRRCDDDYQDDLRLYSAGPRSPSVISELILLHLFSLRRQSELFHNRNYQVSLILPPTIDKWKIYLCFI